MDETGSDQAGKQKDTPSDHLRLAPIDHAEYDALADLFLGDGSFAPEPMNGEGGDDQQDASTQTHEPTHATHTPVLHLTRHADDSELDELDPTQTALGALESLEATDASASALLAELMGGHEPTEEHSSIKIEFVEMPIPKMEVVVLGHLPVRATLWARQYACSRARELGETVALIRAASGSTSIDLITNGADQGDEPISVRCFAHLDGALDAVSNLADRVIMRVDEASEPELLDRAEIEEITILTGADEAAVVASYRLIKTLDATLGEQYIEDEGPRLRLAVMGAGREMAMDACTKLSNAAETFIERPIEIVIGSGRIDATGTTNLYRDSLAHRAGEIIDGLVRAAGIEEPASGLSLVNHSTDTGNDQTELNDTEPVCVEIPARGAEIPTPRVAERKDDAPTLRDGLCAMIPGLSPIESRCPKAPGVDLGIDEHGSLNLIVCDADTYDAMNQLLAAQSWVRNNLGLLIRAEPDLSVPSADRGVDTDAVMHLISDEPRSVREIYDTNVRVYSLARVKVGNVIAQVATPIN